MDQPPVEDTRATWPVVATEDLFRDDWVLALRRDEVHPPGQDEETFRRLVLEHPGAAVVLAADAQGAGPPVPRRGPHRGRAR
jgi:hypothetical protein